MTDAREAVVAHLPAMRAFAISLTRDRVLADDMVQDTVEKAWTRFDSFRPGTDLRAWLFTILRNTVHSMHRRRRRDLAGGDVEELAARSAAPVSGADARLRMIDFRSAFATLPDAQREALLLVGASGFSYEEAADICRVAPGTIKSRVSRARQRLAELMHLEEDGGLDMSDAGTASEPNQARAAAR